VVRRRDRTQSTPPYEGGVAAASADGVVLACMNAQAFKNPVSSLEPFNISNTLKNADFPLNWPLIFRQKKE
jgi:hypothetical protein